MNTLYRKLITSIFIFCLHVLVFSQHMISTKNELTQKTAECLKKSAEILFWSPISVYVIANKNVVDDVLYKLLYTNYTLMTKTNITSRSRYIVIEENLVLLKHLIFKEPSFSKLSKYIILMKASHEEVSELAAYLFSQEFYHMAFLLIDEKGNITLNQYHAKMIDKNQTLFIAAHCDDKFLKDGNSKGMIRPFNHLTCPTNGCKLSTWRLRTDTPTDMLYWKDENGKNVTGSYHYNVIKSFAERHEIQLTNKLNEKDFDITWEEAADHIINGKVDIVYGYNFPDAKIVQRLEIITWSRFYHYSIMDFNKKRVAYSGIGNFFSPLELEVWLGLIVILMLYGCFMYAVKKIYEKKLIREYLHPGDLINMFTEQSMNAPENGGLRVVVGIILFFIFFFNSAYKCEITRTFMVKSHVDPLDNLEKLMKSKFNFTGPKYLRIFFNNSDDPVMKYIYDKFCVLDSNTDINWNEQTEFVVLHLDFVINLIIEANQKNTNIKYYKAKDPFLILPNLFLTRKDHPYSTPLKHFFLIGFQTHAFKNWFPKKLPKKPEETEFEILTNNQLVFCWIILIIGWIGSLTVFFGELFTLRKNNRKSVNKIP